jgi:hypothetical protein
MLTVEGGGAANGAFFRAGLIDAIRARLLIIHLETDYYDADHSDVLARRRGPAECH